MTQMAENTCEGHGGGRDAVTMIQLSNAGLTPTHYRSYVILRTYRSAKIILRFHDRRYHNQKLCISLCAPLVAPEGKQTRIPQWRNYFDTPSIINNT